MFSFLFRFRSIPFTWKTPISNMNFASNSSAVCVCDSFHTSHVGVCCMDGRHTILVRKVAADTHTRALIFGWRIDVFIVCSCLCFGPVCAAKHFEFSRRSRNVWKKEVSDKRQIEVTVGVQCIALLRSAQAKRTDRQTERPRKRKRKREKERERRVTVVAETNSSELRRFI